MKLTEELFLMNKQRNRLKRFRKYENIAYKKKTTKLKKILVIFLELQQSQFGKEAKLKPLKMDIKNIRRCSRKDGKKLIYIKGIYKNKFKLINHLLRRQKLSIMKAKSTPN